MLNYWSGEKSLRQGYIGTIALTIIITQCVSVHNEICVSLLISFHRFYVKFTQFTHVAVCLCESITLLSGNCWPQSAVVHHNWVSIVWFRLQWDQQKWDTVSTYEYDCWPEAGTCDQNSHCDVIRWDKSSKESQLECITVNHSLWCVLSAFYCLFKSVWLMKAHLLLLLHCTFFPFVCLIWHIHTHSYAYSCTQTYIYTQIVSYIYMCATNTDIYTLFKKKKDHTSDFKLGGKRNTRLRSIKTARVMDAGIAAVALKAQMQDVCFFLTSCDTKTLEATKSIDPSFLLLEKFRVQRACKTDRCRRSRKCRNYCEFNVSPSLYACVSLSLALSPPLDFILQLRHIVSFLKGNHII